MKNKTIIFDFDGTIADTLTTGITIYNKIAPEFKTQTIKPEDIPALQKMKPREIMKEYGVSKFKLAFLLVRLKKELSKEIKTVQPFDGMIEVLTELKSLGFRMGIMTSNSKENVEIFLDTQEVSNIFDFIYPGKNIFGKSKVLKKVLRKEKISKNSVFYVGDETRDIEATKDTAIPIVAVSWGFNSKEILETLDPHRLVDTPQELFNTLKRLQ